MKFNIFILKDSLNRADFLYNKERNSLKENEIIIHVLKHKVLFSKRNFYQW